MQEVREAPAGSVEALTMKTLLEAGVHFGHHPRRWNPGMKRYIFAQRGGIHIIDLQQTINQLSRAQEMVAQVVSEGESVLFLGTKKQAQEPIAAAAQACGQFYVTERWLGGTLTNFATIQSRIDHLVRLEEQRNRGEFSRLPKKEALKLEERMEKMNRLFSGIKEMTRLPGLLFVVDVAKEHIAVLEARRVGMPVVALADTDANPRLLDCAVPGNDDAIRSIRLITDRIAEACQEGAQRREAVNQEEPAAEPEFVAAAKGIEE